MEEDAGRDYFVMNPNGRPLRLTRGKERDDVAQILEEVWIKPNSKQQHDIAANRIQADDPGKAHGKRRYDGQLDQARYPECARAAP